ncbi:hypothetical protein IGI04_018423 [Brassica rapa subsp. trilocularis]|uniref:Uncharacterized protein n=1 Tax=Brassica rapa subsp. trilocularis TaxID=1813537 RepID=A0ABQ7MD01_BRACM|nr:hypothetical protein IGI04_018423 [Brassica rapa subsp. trilocularis]
MSFCEHPFPHTLVEMSTEVGRELMDKKDAIAKASKENVLLQIINGKAHVKYSGGKFDALSLIIDGNYLFMRWMTI